jgi:hypothetical protein
VYLANDLVGLDPSVGFVPGGDSDVNVFAQDTALGAIHPEAIKRRQRIGRDRRARPLDDVALVIVVRGLDQKKMEQFSSTYSRSGHRGLYESRYGQ